MVTQVPFDELPSFRRTFGAAVSEERSTLEAFLDLYRDVVVRKVHGLSDDDARRRLVNSETTLTGLVKHLRVVEMNWFQRILARLPDHELAVPVDWEDPGFSFTLAAHDTTDGVAVAYREQCELSRQIAARHDLSDTVPHPELGEVSLRWIYVHMIHETARHVGHADILREQIDGATGS